MFVIVRIRFLGKEKMEKLPGKLENSGKTKVLFCFVRYGLRKVVRKKKSGQLQRKVGKQAVFLASNSKCPLNQKNSR
jgi:hypothetical protein